MLIDTRIIARQGPEPGAMHVLAEAQRILFMDGSEAVLHQVQAHGLPVPCTRAVALPDRLLLLDLARLVPTLPADVRAATARDVPGVVLYSLRRACHTAAQFHALAHRLAAGTWWPMGDEGWRWCRAARDMGLQRRGSQPQHAATIAQPQGAAC